VAQSHLPLPVGEEPGGPVSKAMKHRQIGSVGASQWGQSDAR
jgi:hypothetical protein